MIGYTLLCLIALGTITMGFVVVGVAVRGWKEEEKKKALETASPSQNP